ncbi:MAG: hypothetical protein WD992_03710 [Candidatus Levyibacteriota bacterium]
MITIIHGDDTGSSRKFFMDKKGKSALPVIKGEDLALLDIKQKIGAGLFEKPEAIFVEGFIVNSKPGKRLDEVSEYLKKHSKDIDIYFWERKELSKKQLSQFGTAVTVETFKIPKNTFGFLDGLRPGNGRRNVELFHSALAGSSDELLFFMLVRQFRLLLAVSSNSPIGEVKRLAPWQKSKLLSQVRLFTPEQLRKIYKNLYEIDLGQKTGSLTMPLTQTIDFFLLDL